MKKKFGLTRVLREKQQAGYRKEGASISLDSGYKQKQNIWRYT